MKQAIFICKRDHYGQDKNKIETTLGELFRPDGTLFGYVLEDVVRAGRIKVKGATAIPSTKKDFTYKVGIRKSPKYGEVVVIYTSVEKRDGYDIYVLEHRGVRFEMILAHGGNDALDTEGCLLVNKNRNVEDFSAWGSLKDEFVKEVKELQDQGFDVRLRVINKPQER